jgi:hypothetical protein
MQTVPVFREYAQECLRMAGEAGSEKGRQFLIEMARCWHALAQEREQNERADGLNGRSAPCKPAD